MIYIYIGIMSTDRKSDNEQKHCQKAGDWRLAITNLYSKFIRTEIYRVLFYTFPISFLCFSILNWRLTQNLIYVRHK